MEQLAKPYFYQVLVQQPKSGPLVLDKGNIAPQVPIVVSAVSDTTQAGDTITLFFNGAKLGDPLLVKNPNELVYDLLVDPDDWPEGIADAYVTVTRRGAVVATSQSVNLQVKNGAQAVDVQRCEGLLLGLYNPGVVDSWVVPGAYSFVKGEQIPLSVLAMGRNDQGAVLELMRETTSPEKTERDALYTWHYQNGTWVGGILTQDLQFVRGDHLVLFVSSTQPVNLGLEYAI